MLWQGEDGEPPRDLVRLREAAERSAAALAAEVGRLAATMAARPLRGAGDGPALGPGDGLELRAAGAVADALGELAELGPLAPGPAELAATIAELEFRVWSGPVEGRVRIASPYRLRAGRFDHVFVGSLQDGEFPRRDRGGDPFLSEAQRGSLGLDPRRDSEAEERYLFGVCLSLPRRRLFLSYRDSDENGGAESRSPLLDDVRALLAPPPDGSCPDPVEEAITRGRDLARVVHPLAEAPSEDELARALAAHGPGADAGALLAAGWDRRRAGRPARAPDCRRARAPRPPRGRPGPLTNPAAIESLAAVPAYGGTTLEGFDVCSYRWFVSHELDPQPLDPPPDPLVQGGLMHAALERLYKERPGGDPLPRPGSLAAWSARGRELVAEIVAERELGSHPAERAMARRVERLLERFLAEEAERETGGFEPWLLEAAFGEHEDSERPALELDGWGLHGAIDRVDRAPDGRALVIDYKLSGSVTPREKFEEQAKLQLPLYLLAVAEHWGGEPVGGLYHPLRGTSTRRPRGVVAEEAAVDLAGYGLYDRDLVDAEGLERAAGRLPPPCRRDRRPHAQRRHPPRPGPAPRPARARHLPQLLHLRPDLPPRPGARVRGGRRGGGAMSRRAPTPEQAAAIEIGGRDVLLEAGAGTGKTGVMVDRYCRLACDKGVSPDAILAFTFTDKAAAELRQRIRAELTRRAEAGSERAAKLLTAIGGAWVTTIHGFCNRLLAGHPVAAGIDPGFRVLDAPETTRAAREAFDEALRDFLAPESAGSPVTSRGRSWWRPSTSTGCGGSWRACTRSCAAAARREPRLPEPPPSDPVEAIARRSKRPGRRWRRCARAIPSASWSSGRWRGWASRDRHRAWTSCGRCAPTARRRRSPPTARRSTRRSPPSPRPARAASPTATWPSCWSCSRPASRRPRNAAPGSTSRTCRSSPPGCWSGPRSARPTGPASATCWSTSSRTPTACSCG